MDFVAENEKIPIAAVSITKEFMILIILIALLMIGMEIDWSRRNAYGGYWFKCCFF